MSAHSRVHSESREVKVQTPVFDMLPMVSPTALWEIQPRKIRGEAGEAKVHGSASCRSVRHEQERQRGVIQQTLHPFPFRKHSDPRAAKKKKKSIQSMCLAPSGVAHNALLPPPATLQSLHYDGV